MWSFGGDLVSTGPWLATPEAEPSEEQQSSVSEGTARRPFAAVSWSRSWETCRLTTVEPLQQPASPTSAASDADELAVFFPVALVLRTAPVPVGLVTCTHLSPPSSRPPLNVVPSFLCLHLRGDTGLAALQALEHYVPILRVYRGPRGHFSSLFSFL